MSDGTADTPRATAAVRRHDTAALEVCVVGAGAVGGLIGARMALADADVTLVDQGAHLSAMEAAGLTLVDRDGNRTVVEDVRVTAEPDPNLIPDLIVLGVKSYDLPAVAGMVGQLAGPETTVLPVQNGIPWWYFHGFGGELAGRRIRAVDPDGVIDRHVPYERVLGCVPFVAATVPEPGTVEHVEGEWFPVGELDGAETARASGIVGLFEDAGLRSRALDDVRSELWLKAIGNLAFNPISALTGATMRAICREPSTRRLARTMMEEAKPVAEDLGVTFRRSIEERIEGAEGVGDHETSMLQDRRAGKRLEIEALVGTVVELAELTDRPVPTIEAVYALSTLLDATNRAP